MPKLHKKILIISLLTRQHQNLFSFNYFSSSLFHLQPNILRGNKMLLLHIQRYDDAYLIFLYPILVR